MNSIPTYSSVLQEIWIAIILQHKLTIKNELGLGYFLSMHVSGPGHKYHMATYYPDTIAGLYATS